MQRCKFLLSSWLVGSLLLGSALVQPQQAHAFVWPNAPDRAAELLASSDPEQRELAIQQIRALPPALAKPLLLKALADEDSGVRVAAARAAGRLKWPEATDIVADWLVDPDVRVRLAACEAIRSAPTAKAVTALGRVLSDSSEEVRMAAVLALARATGEEAATLLLGHLDDPSPEVRAEVVAALGRLGDRRAVLPLVGRIQDAVPLVRKRVARALGELADPKSVSALMLALSDGSSDVRVEAALALGRVGGDDAIAALLPLATTSAGLGANSGPATEPVLALRRAALRSLARIGSPQALQGIVQALAFDRLETGRSPAREALVSVGPDAVQAIGAALQSNPSANVGVLATQALGQIGDLTAVPILVASLRRGVVPTLETLKALEQLPSSAALPAVLEALEASSPEVRLSALRVAIAILDQNGADGRVVEPALQALDAPGTSPEERLLLTELLGTSGSPRVEGRIVPLASAKNLSVRRSAVQALGELGQGSKAIDDALLAALSDEFGSVRMDAAKSLKQVGRGEIAPILIDRLIRSDEEDRAAVGIALSGVLARTKDAPTLRDAREKIVQAPASARDAIFEGLGLNPAGLAELSQLEGGAQGDRQKLAEVLAGQAERGLPLLKKLAADSSAMVRANAAWSLGFVATKAEVAELTTLLADRDVSVASNAAASLGRVAARSAEKTLAAPLCSALKHASAYVRANAAAGLTLAGHSCEPKELAAMLPAESDELARLALVRLLSQSQDPSTRAALAVCGREDTVARVSNACERALREPWKFADDGTRVPLLVFVVPDGADQPVAEAAFTLILPDGTLRLGAADRRGALLEIFTPKGDLELGVPAAFAFKSP